MKSLGKVLIEGLVVGLVLVALFFATDLLLKKINMNLSQNQQLYLTLFLAGALVHIIFEYTGLNKMYVDNYYK